MSIKEEEKVLFDKLRDSNPIIVEDGIVDEAEYLASRYKILYVMKEVDGERMELKRVSKRWGQTSNSKEIDKEVKANK